MNTLYLVIFRLIALTITYFIFKLVCHYTFNPFEIYVIYFLQGLGFNEK